MRLQVVRGEYVPTWNVLRDGSVIAVCTREDDANDILQALLFWAMAQEAARLRAKAQEKGGTADPQWDWDHPLTLEPS